MKITAEHLGLLRTLVAPLDSDETRAAYVAGDFPRAGVVRGLDMRYRWDLFHAATRGQGAVVDTLYAYLTDKHIDTALRSLVAPLRAQERAA